MSKLPPLEFSVIADMSGIEQIDTGLHAIKVAAKDAAQAAGRALSEAFDRAGTTGPGRVTTGLRSVGDAGRVAGKAIADGLGGGFDAGAKAAGAADGAYRSAGDRLGKAAGSAAGEAIGAGVERGAKAGAAEGGKALEGPLVAGAKAGAAGAGAAIEREISGSLAKAGRNAGLDGLFGRLKAGATEASRFVSAAIGAAFGDGAKGASGAEGSYRSAGERLGKAAGDAAARAMAGAMGGVKPPSGASGGYGGGRSGGPPKGPSDPGGESSGAAHGAAYSKGFLGSVNGALGGGFKSLMQGVLQGVGQQITMFAANAAGALKDFALDRTAITSFDTAKAKVSTLTNDMSAMGKMAREVSANVGYSASQTEVMAASYDVLSAGFSKASDAANILTASQKGAIGGMSDINTVGNATTTILNAYALSAGKADAVVNQMIGTQNAGKIVVGEYASLIGQVATMAAGAGVRLDELNGLIATATVKGVPAGSAIAGIRQAISSVLKPSKQAADLAQELGVSFDGAALKTGGFTGILQQLKDKGADSQGNLIKLFGSVEAVAAIAPSAGAGLADLAKNIETINSTSADDAFNKMANSMEGLAKKNAVLKEELALKFQVATSPLFEAANKGLSELLTRLNEGSPLFTGLTESAKRFGDILTKNPQVIDATIAAIQSLLQSGIGQLETGVKGFTAALEQNPALISDMATKMADAAKAAIDFGTGFAQGLAGVGQALAPVVEGIGSIAKGLGMAAESNQSFAGGLGQTVAIVGALAVGLGAVSSAVSIVAGVVGGITSAIGFAGAAATGLSAAFAAVSGGVGAVALAIGGMGGAVSAVAAVVSSLAIVVGSGLGAAFMAVAATVTSLAAIVAGGLGAAVSALAALVTSGLGAAFSGIVTAVGAVAAAISGPVVLAIGAAVAAVAAIVVIVKNWDAICKAVGQTIASIGGVVSGLLAPTGALGAAWALIKAAVAAVLGPIGSIAGAVVGAVQQSSLFKLAWDGAAAIVGAVLDPIYKIADAIGGAIGKTRAFQSAWAAVSGAVSKGVGAVGKGLGGARDWVGQQLSNAKAQASKMLRGKPAPKPAAKPKPSSGVGQRRGRTTTRTSPPTAQAPKRLSIAKTGATGQQKPPAKPAQKLELVQAPRAAYTPPAKVIATGKPRRGSDDARAYAMAKKFELQGTGPGPDIKRQQLSLAKEKAEQTNPALAKSLALQIARHDLQIKHNAALQKEQGRVVAIGEALKALQKSGRDNTPQAATLRNAKATAQTRVGTLRQSQAIEDQALVVRQQNQQAATAKKDAAKAERQARLVAGRAGAIGSRSGSPALIDNERARLELAKTKADGTSPSQAKALQQQIARHDLQVRQNEALKKEHERILAIDKALKSLTAAGQGKSAEAASLRNAKAQAAPRIAALKENQAIERQTLSARQINERRAFDESIAKKAKADADRKTRELLKASGGTGLGRGSAAGAGSSASLDTKSSELTLQAERARAAGNTSEAKALELQAQRHTLQLKQNDALQKELDKIAAIDKALRNLTAAGKAKSPEADALRNAKSAATTRVSTLKQTQSNQMQALSVRQANEQQMFDAKEAQKAQKEKDKDTESARAVAKKYDSSGEYGAQKSALDLERQQLELAKQRAALENPAQTKMIDMQIERTNLQAEHNKEVQSELDKIKEIEQALSDLANAGQENSPEAGTLRNARNQANTKLNTMKTGQGYESQALEMRQAKQREEMARDRERALLDKDRALQEPGIILQKSKAGAMRNSGNIEGANQLDKQAAIAERQLQYREQMLGVEEKINSLRASGVDVSKDEAQAMRDAVSAAKDFDLSQVNSQFDTFQQEIMPSVQGAVGGFFKDLLSGTKSTEEAFGDMINNITSKILDFAVNQMVSSIFGGMMGGGGGGLGGMLGGGGGGGGGGLMSIFGFATGGDIKQQSDQAPLRARKDSIGAALRKEGPNSILAALTPGELVLTVAQTKAFYEAGIDKEIPGFKQGGIIPGASPQPGGAMSSTPSPNPSRGSMGASSGAGPTINLNVNGGGDGIDYNKVAKMARQAAGAEISAQKRPRGLLV